MTFNLQRILGSKRAYRQTLAAKPIAEKLRMLDALRERELAISRARQGVVKETAPKYQTREKA